MARNGHPFPGRSSRAGLGVRREDGRVWVALADAIPHPGSLLGWVLMAPADPSAPYDGLAVEEAEWVALDLLPSLHGWEEVLPETVARLWAELAARCADERR